MTGFTVTKWSFLCQFTTAEMYFISFLIKTEFNWLELTTCMTGITVWLIFRHTTWTPKVVLCPEYRFVYYYWTNLRRYRKWYICSIQSSLERVRIIFLNCYSRMINKIWMQMLFKVWISFSYSLSLLLKFTEQVILSCSIQFSYLFFDIYLFLYNRILLILSRLCFFLSQL